MSGNNSNGSRAAWARGFMALLAIILAMGLASMASPAAAAPFAYVANTLNNTVSVIDTGQTPPSLVATIPVGKFPTAVAVTPDGKHVYVTNTFGNNSGSVSVIRTATNTVVATVAGVPGGGESMM
jgi:YVTN family beta-propeller protein